jgi:beta-lactamase regulating signal transducer with metallopeptidase domain
MSVMNLLSRREPEPVAQSAAPITANTVSGASGGYVIDMDDKPALPEKATAQAPALDTARLLRAVWLAGSCAAGVWFIGTNILFYARLRRSRQALTVEGCSLPVYRAEGLSSPCLFGLFRPAVYLTPKAAQSGETMRYVLTHEACHYRHGDHVWSLLRGLCLAVWWWNPLVWAAAILSRNDGELACDEAVIQELGEDSRLAYGRTLIGMISVREAPAAVMRAATTMVSGKRGIRERLNVIVRRQKAVVWAVAAVVVLIAVCVGCTFTGAQTPVASAEPSASDGVTERAQELYDSRNPYEGDASADNALLKTIGVPEAYGQYSLELETAKEPYVLRLVFEKAVTESGAFNEDMIDIATLLLALIDNVSEIQWRYNMIDKSADASGVFTGSLTAADAAAALNTKDIKEYGKSAADVQALLDWLGTKETAMPVYVLMRLSKGEIQSATEPLTGEDARLAEDVINNSLVKSAAWPAVDIKSLDVCCELRRTLPDGTATDFYAFTVDGKAVLQMGADGYYTRLDDALDEKLVKLANTGSAVTEEERLLPRLEKVDRTDLDACIRDAIISQNLAHIPGADFVAESHVTLKTVSDGEAVTVYVMAMYRSVGYAGAWFFETGGGHYPAAITFNKDKTGAYELTEYWEPRDGSEYAPSLKAKFPSDIYQDALDTQKYVMAQTQACYAQAVEYGRVSVDAELDRLLEIITSWPAESSNPGAYIKAHYVEYREMLYLGDYTLRYCFERFEKGGETGLEGHIMASACREILGDEDIKGSTFKTGQDWYDTFMSNVSKLRTKWGDATMREEKPRTWRLLEQSGASD